MIEHAPTQEILDRVLKFYPKVQVYKPDGHLLTRWGGTPDEADSMYVKLASVSEDGTSHLRGAWLNIPIDDPENLRIFEADAAAACETLTDLAENNVYDD